MFTLCLCLILPACTNLVFQPTRQHMLDPREHGVILEDRWFSGEDDVALHGWWLPARVRQDDPSPPDARGTVIFLHGNAQNISSHIRSVAWLPAAGYNVYLYDYRGFGKSGGSLDYELTRRDLLRAIDFVIDLPEANQHPVFVFGQSLGGAIAISALGGADARLRLAGVISEGAPASLRQISREILGSNWLSWVVQIPLSWTISDAHSPRDQIGKLAPTPLLVVHSKEDRVVPFHHGDRLQALAPEGRVWRPATGPHIQAFSTPASRQALLDFLAHPPPTRPPRTTPP